MASLIFLIPPNLTGIPTTAVAKPTMRKADELFFPLLARDTLLNPLPMKKPIPPPNKILPSVAPFFPFLY